MQTCGRCSTWRSSTMSCLPFEILIWQLISTIGLPPSLTLIGRHLKDSRHQCSSKLSDVEPEPLTNHMLLRWARVPELFGLFAAELYPISKQACRCITSPRANKVASDTTSLHDHSSD
ncbi:uncharacterized protein PV07_02090 [Cladophialophora immunda]|uniref:Uncharacterized protein n=1 Tax=Cladophialophora immunda TaxID=569365 RepID=A0A0D2BD03_9EURO|nr:uncharacterized protein PV07_02090 [Cladophialophora immunda]KIW35392.1 hypothetical protein PV07_02090 [Cladophialophora immunda]